MHKIDITKNQQVVLDPLAVVCLVLEAGHLEYVGYGLVAVYKSNGGELMGFIPAHEDGGLVEAIVGNDNGKAKLYLAFNELIPAMRQ